MFSVFSNTLSFIPIRTYRKSNRGSKLTPTGQSAVQVPQLIQAEALKSSDNSMLLRNSELTFNMFLPHYEVGIGNNRRLYLSASQ